VALDGKERCTYGEEHKVLLVVLAHAVIDPRTVVVHLADAALANGAVMGPLGLDAAALGALVEHLALAVAHLLDHLLGGVSSGYSALKMILITVTNIQ